MGIIFLLDFLIIAMWNACVLMLVAIFLVIADYQEDKAYYKKFEYKQRGEKLKS